MPNIGKNNFLINKIKNWSLDNVLNYNYFLFCHPEMFKAVYLYEKSLLWHTIWVVYALGPKVHKKKFW